MKSSLIILALITLAFCAEQINHDNSAAESLLEYLDKMSSDITAEQLEHSNLKRDQDAQCDEEINFRNREVQNAVDAAAAAQISLDRCNNAVTSTKANLAQVALNVRAINNILSNLENRRNEEREHFQEVTNNQLKPAILAVQDAYPILQELSASAVGFAQLTRHMTKLFQKVTQAKRAQSVAPLLSALVQLGTEQVNGVSRDLVLKIQGLFENLEQDLFNALQHAIEVENARQQLYDETVTRYNSVLRQQDEYQTSLNSYLEIVSACVVTESDVLQQAHTKQRRNQDALDAAAAMCLAFQNEYDNASQARQDEQELLVKIKAFIREQADAFGEYGVDEGSSAAFRRDFENSRSRQASLIQSFVNSRLEKSKGHAAFVQKTAPAKCKACKKGFVQKKLGY